MFFIYHQQDDPVDFHDLQVFIYILMYKIYRYFA